VADVVVQCHMNDERGESLRGWLGKSESLGMESQTQVALRLPIKAHRCTVPSDAHEEARRSPVFDRFHAQDAICLSRHGDGEESHFAA
jgi:hypothetical protein